MGCCPIPHQFLKKLDKNFYQNAITLRFSGQYLLLFKPSPSWRRCHAVTDEGNFVLYKVEIKRFKLNFSLIKKIPAPSKISLRSHIPCASGNRLLQSFWQQIQDLRFKINAIEILFDKVLENQNLNNITYNFLSKMQWNCILPKVLLNFFQKIFRVWGETPRSFSSINLYLA